MHTCCIPWRAFIVEKSVSKLCNYILYSGKEILDLIMLKFLIGVTVHDLMTSYQVLVTLS